MKKFKKPIGISGYTPLNYSQINNINGHINPSMVKYCDSATFEYWQRSLFQRAISTIDFEGLPDEWQGAVKDFFQWCLFAYGFVGVFEDNRYGLSFQPGNLYGFDFYYQPTEFIVANPKLSKRFILHKQAELIRLTPDYMGIWDIITYYAMMLSMLDSGINMSIINCKLAFLAAAKNKAAAETLKAMFDEIQNGNPCVVYDKLLEMDPTSKDDPFVFIDRNLKNNYLTTDQLMDRSTILSAFDAEIGINSLPYNKKERLVTAEAESRGQDSTARLMVWKDSLDSSLELVNKLFNTNIRAELAYQQEGGNINGKDNTFGNGELSKPE